MSGNPPPLDSVTGDMWMPSGMRSVVAVLLSLASLWVAGCTATEGSDEPASSPSSQTRSSSEAPDACIDTAEATRETIAGTPTWARFCPGPEGRTAPAEVPSDALTSHLEALVESSGTRRG